MQDRIIIFNPMAGEIGVGAYVEFELDMALKFIESADKAKEQIEAMKSSGIDEEIAKLQAMKATLSADTAQEETVQEGGAE